MLGIGGGPSRVGPFPGTSAAARMSEHCSRRGQAVPAGGYLPNAFLDTLCPAQDPGAAAPKALRPAYSATDGGMGTRRADRFV